MQARIISVGAGVEEVGRALLIDRGGPFTKRGKRHGEGGEGAHGLNVMFACAKSKHAKRKCAKKKCKNTTNKRVTAVNSSLPQSQSGTRRMSQCQKAITHYSPLL